MNNLEKTQEFIWNRELAALETVQGVWWQGLSIVGTALSDVCIDTGKHYVKIIFEVGTLCAPDPKLKRNFTDRVESVLIELVRGAVARFFFTAKLSFQIAALTLRYGEAKPFSRYEESEPFTRVPKKSEGRIAYIFAKMRHNYWQIRYHVNELKSWKNGLRDVLKHMEELPVSIAQIALTILLAPLEILFKREKQPPPSREDAAAIKLQKIYRGYKARQAFLPRDFPEYKRLLEGGCKNMPRAKDGKTRVYFPAEMPEVVFKQSGSQSASRFHAMSQARQILLQENCTRLIIPKARKYKEFLIEERLPVNTNRYYNLQEYVDHREKYDEVARELTRFFSRAQLTDLWGEWGFRYDNFPLFDGELGLIDLESFEQKKGRARLDRSDVRTLMAIFPYHTEIILDEAKKLGAKFLSDPSIKETAIKEHMELYEEFDHYRDFLREKGITSESPYTIDITPDRHEALKKALAAEILRLNQEGIPSLKKSKDFLEGDENALAAVALPMLIKCLNDFISRRKRGKVTTEWELIQERYFLLENNEVKFFQFDIDSLRPFFKEGFKWNPLCVLQPLFGAFMKELIRGKEVCDYNYTNYLWIGRY